jgi:hypothetical protein
MFGLEKAVAIGTSGLAIVCTAALWWASHDLSRVRVDRDKWHGVADTWEQAAKDFKRAFERSEDLRERENSQAVTAINDSAAFCEKRVAQAKRDVLSLRSLLNKEPKREPNGCAIRELLPSDELRAYLDAPTG